MLVICKKLYNIYYNGVVIGSKGRVVLCEENNKFTSSMNIDLLQFGTTFIHHLTAQY